MHRPNANGMPNDFFFAGHRAKRALLSLNNDENPTLIGFLVDSTRGDRPNKRRQTTPQNVHSMSLVTFDVYW